MSIEGLSGGNSTSIEAANKQSVQIEASAWQEFQKGTSELENQDNMDGKAASEDFKAAQKLFEDAYAQEKKQNLIQPGEPPPAELAGEISGDLAKETDKTVFDIDGVTALATATLKMVDASPGEHNNKVTMELAYARQQYDKEHGFTAHLLTFVETLAGFVGMSDSDGRIVQAGVALLPTAATPSPPADNYLHTASGGGGSDSSGSDSSGDAGDKNKS